MADEVMTFDEILSDPLYKSEFDRRVTKAITTATAKYQGYEDIKGQLTEANKTIEGFKAMDIDGIKAAADDWKAKAEKAEADAAAKIADMEFNSLLDTSITAAKGRNAKAVRGLLDVDTIKASKNQTEDIKAALEALKATDGYLFEDTETPPPYAGGTGGTPFAPKGDPGLNAIRAAAGLKTD